MQTFQTMLSKAGFRFERHLDPKDAMNIGILYKTIKEKMKYLSEENHVHFGFGNVMKGDGVLLTWYSKGNCRVEEIEEQLKDFIKILIDTDDMGEFTYHQFKIKQEYVKLFDKAIFDYYQ